MAGNLFQRSILKSVTGAVSTKISSRSGDGDDVEGDMCKQHLSMCTDKPMRSRLAEVPHCHFARQNTLRSPMRNNILHSASPKKDADTYALMFD